MYFEKNNKPIIKFSDNVNLYFEELTTILFLQNYFGSIDSAIRYVAKMRKYIEAYVAVLPAKTAPSYFSKYQKGMKYISYTPNNNTTWYIFFLQENNRFLVCYITNNHYEGQYIR